jgi:lysine-ketoglutarate reductase/saccharopine dehydrogenase-like protein (TIGR00300 family)
MNKRRKWSDRMNFKIPEYKGPDFSKEPLKSSPDAEFEAVKIDGAAPENYHATTIFPEYIKVNGKWLLLKESRMDCLVVLNESGSLEVKEFRNLRACEKVVTGRSEDGSEGIYVYAKGFLQNAAEQEMFAFRTGRSRETSFSMDYDRLYELLRYEKENGYIVWVLGPAAAFDSDSRQAMSSLIERGYAHAVLAGNALAVHDMEGDVFKTALGQDIYHQTSIARGHYHHIDVINKARKYSSLREFIEKENIRTGIVQTCIKKNIPLVLAGSIRDDGPLPDVFGNVYEAQDAMRAHTRKATTLICLATQLHTIAAGNMTPSYHVKGDSVRPVFIYTVDVSEFVVNKLKDRGSLSVTSIVTNIQDFLVQVSRNV